MKDTFDQRRIYPLNSETAAPGPVIYWMSRDQRVHDNWAMLYAQKLAKDESRDLAVAFCLVPNFLSATMRQYGFMLKGLEQVEAELVRCGIPFHLLIGDDPSREMIAFAKKMKAGVIVTDFDPLRIKRKWRESVAASRCSAVIEVDAHNIVPCRAASPKQEFGAYTLRPKIKKLLREFLTDIPPLTRRSGSASLHAKTDWKAAYRSLQIDMTVPEVDWCASGEKAARRALESFIRERLSEYDNARNDPTRNGQSDLSPYLHFGQISAQRVALEIEASGCSRAGVSAFLEELVIRRELSDNFCFYNPNYDSVDGFPAWAQKTLHEHAKDKREYVYADASFEHAETHDPLWNAAQMQLLTTGKMHGYMRMYWAKKILEWTKSPGDALRVANHLNDKYELDGRDPNGYAGTAWSIGGVHDRAWFDRPIFGKIRYMSYGGCKSKFDIAAYMKKYGEKRTDSRGHGFDAEDLSSGRSGGD